MSGLSILPNITLSPYQGDCVAPWLQAELFDPTEGHLGGRFCSAAPQLPGAPTCCLPCPVNDWVYSDRYVTFTYAAQALNVIGLCLTVFMLVSYLVLPAQKTRSHYLSVGLIVAALMMSLGFVIPAASHADQCANAITPNDMYSSIDCAWSGAFVISGGMCSVSWIFIRALSMHLQICWDVVPGRKFFYAAQFVGWGVPAILFIPTMILSGVSFRFGAACHVNHDYSMAVFWGPLMAFAGTAGILQVFTFCYCVNVYLRNLWSESPQATQETGSGLPTYNQGGHGFSGRTARAVYMRIRKVVWLQWRGISIVSIIMVNCIFFAIVFVYLDNLQQSVLHQWPKVEPWAICMALHPTEKNLCVHLARSWTVGEPTLDTVLLMLSLAGLQVFLFLTRPSVFSAWVTFFKERLTPHRQEFVSLDARSLHGHESAQDRPILVNRGYTSTAFEMQKPHNLSLDTDMKSMTSATLVNSPDDAYRSLHHKERMPSDFNGHASPRFGDGRNEYFGGMTTVSELPAGPYAYDGQTSPASGLSELPSYDRYYYQNNNNWHRHGQSPEPPTGMTTPIDPERRYRTPAQSFSSPTAPNRQTPNRRSVTFQPHDPYWRAGASLSPTREMREIRENTSQSNFTGDYR